jgi:hypothetical protein
VKFKEDQWMPIVAETEQIAIVEIPVWNQKRNF